MKKLYYLIVLTLILGLALTGCSLLSNVGQVPTAEQSGITYLTKHTEGEPFVSMLYAGQEFEVGTVSVWNDDVELHITYNTTGGWVLTETHLAVATALDDIPQKKGNPIPGKFPYQCCYDEDKGKWVFKIKKGGAPGATCVADGNTNATLTKIEYIIPLSEIGEGVDCEELLFIAAHASLLNQDNIVGFVPDTGDPGDPIYQEETAWGDKGLDFPGKNWATYFNYTIQCEYEEEWPEGGTISVAYEDLPIDGGNDWDYNDFVVDIDTLATFFGTSANRKLTQIDFTVRPEVKISLYTHIMHLDTDTFGCHGTYELYYDGILVGFGNYDHTVGIDVILVPNTVSPPDEILLTFYFDPGCDFSFPEWDQSLYHGENLFFDPYLYVNNTGEDIHIGDVRMLAVPTDWLWPTPDGNAIWNVYPKVIAGAPPIFVPYWWTP
jgi:hypothetical protein